MESVAEKSDELDRSLRVLEWPEVQARLLACCQWSGGREVLQGFGPLDDIEDLHDRQAIIKEAMALDSEGHGKEMGGLIDPVPALKAARRGRVLQAEQILDVELLCAVSRDVFERMKGRSGDIPRLVDLLRPVVPHNKLEQRLHRSVSRDGKLTDESSATLRTLRAEIRECEEKVQRSLQGLLRHPDLSKTYQEPIITQRDGRFVIPVKADYKGRFPGLVIDQSASGATLFMEPFVVVNLSNDLRQKQLAEKAEIQRVFKELSSLIGEHSGALLQATQRLSRLDAYMGIARYAAKIDGILPKVSESGDLVLRGAHHPLIDENSVPIEIELKNGCRTLVITGPNTGGKTVSLKIVGLLSLMAASGFPVPARENSTFPLITRVWADIGDEQSLSQSLSTFSGHLVHILEILKGADRRSLVLLDELGAGTDPSEGGALGVALISELHRRGCRTVVSTHLSQLKVFAKKTEGFDNAAVEFDTKTLKPTYRVIMGIPGRSNALSIAAQLGLPESLLREARSFLGGGYQGVEQLLDDLEIERDAAVRLESKLDKELRKTELAREKLEATRVELLEAREAELDKAREEAAALLEETKRTTRSLMREFQEGLKEAAAERKEALLSARRLARDWADRVSVENPNPKQATTPVEESEIDFDHLGDKARALSREAESKIAADFAKVMKRKQRKKKKEQVPKKLAKESPQTQKGPEKLKSGTKVYCPRLGQQGEVVAQKGQRVDVKLGALKMSFTRDELELLKNQSAPQKSEKKPSGGILQGEQRPSGHAQTMSMNLDVRGQNVDMAILEVDRYIDQAFLAKINKVEILHGKGTGVLRVGIQNHLKRHPQVKEFRDGDHYEGGWGVTIVNLRV